MQKQKLTKLINESKSWVKNFKFLMNGKALYVLFYLSSHKYHTKSHLEINCTSYALWRILNRLEDDEFITTQKNRREKIVNLTEKGKKVVGYLKEIRRRIK